MEPQMFYKIVFSFIAIAVYMLAFSMTGRFVSSFGEKQSIAEKRIFYTKKFFKAFILLFLFIGIILIWGIDIKGIFIFASSFFAFVGIALFASWSILSNITTSIVIFFSFPYKIGDRIKVVDGDNSIEGCIRDMTFFNIHIECSYGNTAYYPNNLVVQKAVLKIEGKSCAGPADLSQG